jgi:hypothetical protein
MTRIHRHVDSHFMYSSHAGHTHQYTKHNTMQAVGSSILSRSTPGLAFSRHSGPMSRTFIAPKRRGVTVAASSSDETSGALIGAAAVNLALSPICIWSEYTLATTGAGLPPGPSGLLGAAEGVSYLMFVVMVGLSIKSKVQTGSGLPAGPGGLVGASEGIAFLQLLGSIAAAIASTNASS